MRPFVFGGFDVGKKQRAIAAFALLANNQSVPTVPALVCVGHWDSSIISLYLLYIPSSKCPKQLGTPPGTASVPEFTALGLGQLGQFISTPLHQPAAVP